MAVKKKSVSLRVIFPVYLLSIATGLVLALLLFVGVMMLGQMAGIYIPANNAESTLLREKEAIASSSPFDAALIPQDCTYVLISENGDILQSSMSEADQRNALAYAKDQSMVFPLRTGSYMAVERADGTCCIIHYYVIARYACPWMNAHLPSINVTALILLAASCLLGCTAITLLWARYLSGQLRPILSASEKIACEDLDFEIQPSGITEFNTVLQGLSEMKQALKASLLSQWQLEKNRREQIAALAHDIKTPLAVVKGNAELLAGTTLPETQREYLNYIQKNSVRIEQYTRALIEINQSDQAAAARPVHISGSALCQRLKETALELAAIKNQTVHFFASAVPEKLYLDPVLLERACANVVSNALEYNPVSASVDIRFVGEPGGFSVQVIDRGEGFSEEGLVKAAQQFYRGDKSRHCADHYGIGLYMAHQIMQMHKGRLILANNRDTPGACVTLWLPV